MNEPKRCGACYFTEIIPQDFSRRVCFGGPPSAYQAPAARGQVTFQMARPIVAVTDRACSFWRAKDAADVAMDTTTMLSLQNGQKQ